MKLDRDLAVGEPACEVFDLDPDDLVDIVLCQIAEDDRLVQTIEKLRFEVDLSESMTSGEFSLRHIPHSPGSATSRYC